MAKFFDKTSNNGRLDTTRYQFQDHIDGTNYRHKADAIDINPNLTVGSNTYTNVQEFLDNFNTILSNAASFVTIGNGLSVFDGNASGGTYNLAVPSINSTINDILTNPLNENYSRLKNGGVILIKAGTYKVDDTINIPAGITIMGELSGTYLINATTPQKPIFKIKQDSYRIADTAVDPAQTPGFMFSRETKIYNLIISDNYMSPISLGDLTYKNPKNTSNPLIKQELGTNLTIDNVKFLGRNIVSSYSITQSVLETDNATSAANTILTIKNCFIDGFGYGIKFTPTTGNLNHLNFTNNKIKVNGKNNTASDYANNSFIITNACNITVSNNVIKTSRPNAPVNTFIYIANQDLDGGDTTNNCRVCITGNIGNITNCRVLRFVDDTFDSTPTTDFNRTYYTITGNTLDLEKNDTLEIVVAGKNSNFVGDFNGLGALDTAMLYAGTNTTIVHVLPGDYVIYSSLGLRTNITLLGVKNGTQYPNIGISYNNSTRTVYFSNKVSGVKFYKEQTLGADVIFPRVSCGFNSSLTYSTYEGTISFEDCYFNDVGITTDDPALYTSDDLLTKVNIYNCYFKQIGDSDPACSIDIPYFKNINIKNNIFNCLSGSAISISQDGAYSTPTISTQDNLVNIEANKFTFYGNLGPYSPSSDLYLISYNSLVYIQSENIINFNDNYVSCYNLDSASPSHLVLGFTATNIADFDGNGQPSIVKLSGKNINVSNNILHGVRYNNNNCKIAITSTSMNYAIPTLFIEGRNTINIINTVFDYCDLPLQISGESLKLIQANNTTKYSTKNNLCISGCKFLRSSYGTDSTSDYNAYSACLLALDLRNGVNAGYASSYDPRNFITINDCVFVNYTNYSSTSAPEINNLSNALPPMMYNATAYAGTGYTGVFNFINSSKFNTIKVHSCYFDLMLRRLKNDNGTTSNTKYVGLYFENSNAVGNDTNIDLQNNFISIINNVEAISGQNVIGTYIKELNTLNVVSNQFITVNNQNYTPGTIRALEMYTITAENVNTKLIGNSFSRKDTDLSSYLVKYNITTVDAKHAIINNYFDSSYPNSVTSGETELIYVDVTKALIKDNINLLSNLNIGAESLRSLANNAHTSDTNKELVIAATVPNSLLPLWSAFSVASNLSTFVSPETKIIAASKTNIGTIQNDDATNFTWILPITSLPLGAKIKTITITYYYKLTTPGSVALKLGALLYQNNDIFDFSGQFSVGNQSAWSNKNISLSSSGNTTGTLVLDTSTLSSDLIYSYRNTSTKYLTDNIYILLNAIATRTGSPIFNIAFGDTIIKYTF